MIDMAMLIAELKPDANGNIIPPSVREGSASFASAKGASTSMTVVISGGIYNVSTATCGNTCVTCCGNSNFGVSVPAYCPIGETMACTSSAVNCWGTTVQPSWSSSNTSIVTIDGSGSMTGHSIGSANIVADFSQSIVYTGQICTQGTTPPCPTGGPVYTNSSTVQVPTSLKFISVSVLPDGSTGAFGCPPSNNYGIRVDIKYQVLDQQSPAQVIKSSSMTPHEKGTLFDGSAFDNNIGPVNGYPTSSATTAADGTFHDVPFGYCQNTPINTPRTATQNITIIFGGQSYPVRSQTWSVSAPGSSSFGHGTITNTITSPGTGSDVSATR